MAQIHVRFESFHPLLIDQITDSSILLPTSLDSDSLRNTLFSLYPSLPSLQNFDFSIDGQLLSTSIESFLHANNWSEENILTIQIISRIKKPHSFCTELPSQDWISSISSVHDSTFAVGDYSGVVQMLSIDHQSKDLKLKQLAVSLQVDSAFPVKSVLYSPSLKLVLASHGFSTSILSSTDINKAQPLVSKETHTGTIESAAFLSEDSDSITWATGSYDTFINLHRYNTSTNIIQKICTFNGHGSAVTGVAQGCIADQIYSVSLDGSFRIWDINRLEQTVVLNPTLSSIPFLNISTSSLDKNIIAASAADLSIRVWDIRAKNAHQSSRPLVGHSQLVSAVIFSPQSSTTLHSVSQDSTMKTWDLRVIGSSSSRDNSLSTLSSTGPLLTLSLVDNPPGHLLAGGSHGISVSAF